MIYDDGRRATNFYTAGVLTSSSLNDADNVHSFSLVSTTWSTAGVLQSRVTNYDNGSKLTQTYQPNGSRVDLIEDLTNVYNYVTRSTSYNAAGKATSQEILYDNGNTHISAYDSNGIVSSTITNDANNNEAFYTIVSAFTSSGTLNYTITHFDDGRVAVVGGANPNLLAGGAFNDTLNGGGGIDFLEGGGGIDTLVGGADADTFLLQETFAGRDNILDFTLAQGDLLRVSRTAFGNFDGGGSVAGNDWFQSNETGLAEDALDRFIYNSKTGQIFFDADGLGGNAGVLVATLTTKPALTEANHGIFHVVA